MNDHAVVNRMVRRRRSGMRRGLAMALLRLFPTHLLKMRPAADRIVLQTGVSVARDRRWWNSGVTMIVLCKQRKIFIANAQRAPAIVVDGYTQRCHLGVKIARTPAPSVSLYRHLHSGILSFSRVRQGRQHRVGRRGEDDALGGTSNQSDSNENEGGDEPSGKTGGIHLFLLLRPGLRLECSYKV
jgi:hypothetical protein